MKPFYPQAQRDANVQGVVTLAGVINAEGFMTGIRTVGSPDAGLASAAIDAVSQWEFDPTHLDGVPIDTRISISVSFRLE